jgi:hypothetical protein
LVVGGRRALFVEFEGWKTHFVAVVGSRKALLVVIVWIKALCMVVVVVVDIELDNGSAKTRENSAILAANSE